MGKRGHLLEGKKYDKYVGKQGKWERLIGESNVIVYLTTNKKIAYLLIQKENI